MIDRIVYEDRGNGILVMKLNRAPVNAMNPAFLQLLESEMQRLAADGKVRAVVLASDFKVFSAGMDLKEAQAFTLEEQRAAVDGFNGAFAALYGFPKPLIAAVNGAAIAGGMFLALCADATLSVERAKYGLTEVRVGVDFPIGPLEVARDALSAPAFRRILLSGHLFTAAEGVEMGFVDRIVAPEALMDEAVALAAVLGAAASGSTRMASRRSS